jgi:amino acid transporter
MTGYPGDYPPPPPPPHPGYPGYQQPYGYQLPYGYQPPPAGPKNGLGIAALVVAIFALLSCWTVMGGIVLGIVAVVLGIVGRSRAKSGQADNGGIAMAGILLGVLGIIVALVFIPIWMGFFKEVGGSDYLDCVAKAGQDRGAIEDCVTSLQQTMESRLSVTITPTP